MSLNEKKEEPVVRRLNVRENQSQMRVNISYSLHGSCALDLINAHPISPHFGLFVGVESDMEEGFVSNRRIRQDVKNSENEAPAQVLP
ncbi:hypothetical protein CLCR_03770 [Cladophialophora carrionii]|uniref:Uncharacterized protein n=1 Tax=Cladophialophora carrionii TaxID=86049 RepID=A0A1C1CFU2_9EURO|nr:hypothetical protein CLCR_03770 [Cladophialophora carrionii]